MTSTLPKGNLGSVASLLAATLYQEDHNRNHVLSRPHCQFQGYEADLSLSVVALISSSMA